MTTFRYIATGVLPVVYSLLPVAMASANASAMMLTIGMQESRFEYRQQVRGPARSFWQFEQGGGVRGVMRHHSTKAHAEKVLETLRYPADDAAVYTAMEHNDVLAGCFARLLLWTLPGSLPGRDEAEKAWQQYTAAWRPGKPHRHTWDALYAQAWKEVDSAM